MRTEPAPLGICKTVECLHAGRGPVELYDGPGRFCPKCGDLLQRYDPDAPSWSPPPQQTAAADVAAPAPPPAAPSKAPEPRRLRLRGVRWYAVSATVVVTGAVLVMGAMAAGLTGGGAPVVAVCGTSMTDRVMRDVLHAFDAQKLASGNRFEVRTTDCAVRFGVRLSNVYKGRRHTGVLGNDGIVTIVNPQNSVSELNNDDLRKIVTGEVTNWSAVGGRSQPIVVYLPAAGTDEALVVADTLLKGSPVGSSVVRVPSSADAVRAVVKANGAGAIALVAFSSAVPGKVVALRGQPSPSVLSIGEEQYPLSVELTVASTDPSHDASSGSLLRYADSNDAKAIAQRDGIIPVNGPH